MITILNGLLVAVGALQAVILWRTIKAISNQTASSQHIERAWIMTELRCGPETRVLFGGNNTYISGIKLHCINAGNSPAWISEKSGRLVIAQGDGDLPPIPSLDAKDVLQNQPDPLVPGETSTFMWNPMGTGEYRDSKVALIYGVVRYRDIFNEERETFFGYRMTGDQEHRKLIRLAAPPGYNKNT